MEKLTHIKISDDIELPIKCDMYVLAAIQQQYGNVVNFEKLLTGTILTSEDNEKKRRRIEPSADAVIFALPLMVAEGIEIERSIDKNVSYPVETEKAIIMSVTRDFRVLAMELHKEFTRCFKTKK